MTTVLILTVGLIMNGDMSVMLYGLVLAFWISLSGMRYVVVSGPQLAKPLNICHIQVCSTIVHKI